MDHPTVVASIVTRNRKELLRKSLNAVFAQTVPLKETIVVDNASEDGTIEMLAEEFPLVRVVALSENQGGSGGFREAIRAALQTPTDWIWLFDDDCVARPDALEQLLAAAEQLSAPDPPDVLCSRVEWTDGSMHVMNLPIMPRQRDSALVFEAEERPLPIRAASFVSTMFSSRALSRAGLPRTDFFWQTDDIEFTARILREGRGYYVPKSIVEHLTPSMHTAVNDDGRMWYHVRNTTLMIRGRSWRPREKPRLAWWIAQTSFVYLRINHLRLRSIVNLLSALAAGARGKGGERA